MNISYFLLLSFAFVSLSSSASSNDIKFPGQRRFSSNNVPTKQQSKPTSNVYKIMSRSINRIALVLNYLLPISGVKDENFVFSPLNIFQTLSSVMLGSAGQTEKELETLVSSFNGRRINPSGKFTLHKTIGDFLRNVSSENGNGIEVGLSLIMSGGVFIQQGFPIEPTYMENAKNIYGNEVIEVNFEDGNEAAAKINQWVSEKTSGKINSIVDPSIDPQTRAIITGTLYFNGRWEFPFLAEATKWQKFFLGKDGKREKNYVEVEMMVNQALIPYYEDRDKGIQAIGMPYKNRDFYMYLVLPKLGLSLHNLTTCLATKDIETIVEKSRPSEVFFVIPKMKLDAEYNLRNTLERCGSKTMFSPTAADFSDISEGLFISQILHKVTVDVNEAGTVAAAATSTNLNRGGYINFRADRPFFFFIYNMRVGTIAFWGEVNKPSPFK